MCHDEDDLDTTDLTLVDGTQVRAHRRCAVAASAALLAGVTDVERAAAADYVRATAGDADVEPGEAVDGPVPWPATPGCRRPRGGRIIAG